MDERLAAMLHRARWVVNFLGGTAELLHRRLQAAVPVPVISVDPRPTETTLATGTHITSQWASAIREQGLDIGEPQAPYIRIGDGREGTRTRAPSCRARRVIVHPGSGGRGKCWPIEKFIALAESLQDAESPQEIDVTWMLGPAECEPADDRFDPLRCRVDAGPETLIVEPDRPEALRGIADAALYVGNDGGMTHAAAAIGLPTIAIFQATNPAVWRPLGEHVTTIAPEKSARSLADVTVEHVRLIVRQRLRPE